MILTVHVKPNARETKVVARHDERTFVIALHAPAHEGRANEELISFLAKKLHLPKTFIMLKTGHKSRIKHLELPEGTRVNF